MRLLHVLKGIPSKEEQPAFLEEVESQCQVCVHRTSPVTCKAFPEGIPLAILLGAFDHTHPYDIEGVTDNGILFQPIDLA